ncbi:MAG TPA: PrsW family glutamic-type intramembrane protease [Ktedonobacteraceae bacterium]|nr:PrsW family glutamic-type intramembrane protease [Ktedonobacteraceae bacterium]
MSANYQGPGSEEWGPQTPSVARENSSSQDGQSAASANWGVNHHEGMNGVPPEESQQSWREYTSSTTWTAPGTPFPTMPQTPPPAYSAAGPYQPVYPGPPGGPWQPPAPVQPYPGYPPHAMYPGYGYGAPGQFYPGYGYYAWPQVPPKPKRDTYLLVVSIIAFACSCLAILGGLLSLGIAALASVAPRTDLAPDQFFASLLLFLALAFVGIVGGGFCFYHSMRSLFFKKPSKAVWLPHFWVFLLGYLAVLGLGYWLHVQEQDVAFPVVTGLLIYLGGLLPALTVLALGLHRLRSAPGGRWSMVFYRDKQVKANVSVSRPWPTTWRRLTLALVSGATLSVTLAFLLEFIFLLILVGARGTQLLQALNDPNASGADPSLYGLLLITLAVVAPVVEELVKPLAVIILIGRVRSKAEAFALGLACGIGFDLVETVSYIGSGYTNWLHVVLLRSGAGLLHGFGAAMMALAWYCLTHRPEGNWRWSQRLLPALGYGGYAVLQHMIWNGSFGLGLFPGPIQDFFQNWSWSLGPLFIDGSDLFVIVGTLGMLIFFIYMAGRLRTRSTPPSESASLVSA